MAETTKPCARCKQTLPLDDFRAAPRMRLGKASYCRPCEREWRRERHPIVRERANAKARETRKRNYTPEQGRRRHLKHKYGLDWDDYQRLIEEQGGACAICEAPEAGGKGDWHVDHDHATGAVRGLLCSGCNVGLGMFKDNGDLLRAAANYLNRGIA